MFLKQPVFGIYLFLICCQADIEYVFISIGRQAAGLFPFLFLIILGAARIRPFGHWLSFKAKK